MKEIERENKEDMNQAGDSFFGEELYNLLGRMLNSPSNRSFFDSIRGEYGVLRYLLEAGEDVAVGTLSERLQVVPGRMTDILKSLEKKGFIQRRKDPEDRRVVKVTLLEDGCQEARNRREQIRQKYAGLAAVFSEDEARELLRLLNLLLTYRN